MPLQDRVLTSLAAATIAVLAVGNVDAHPRARVHRHDKATAVIVLGKTRPALGVATINGTPYGVLDFNVKPRLSEVWVDGTYRGTCDAFDGFPGKLSLAPGMHTIKLVIPDGTEVARDLRVRAGVEINVGLDLR